MTFDSDRMSILYNLRVMCGHGDGARNLVKRRTLKLAVEDSARNRKEIEERCGLELEMDEGMFPPCFSFFALLSGFEFPFL